MTDADDTKRTLEQWSAALLEELELVGAPVDIDAILRLAGIAAHSVIRPAAPVTTYIVGYAAGLAAAADADAAPSAKTDAAAASLRAASLRAASLRAAFAKAEALARRFGGSASQ